MLLWWTLNLGEPPVFVHPDVDGHASVEAGSSILVGNDSVLVTVDDPYEMSFDHAAVSVRLTD